MAPSANNTPKPSGSPQSRAPLQSISGNAQWPQKMNNQQQSSAQGKRTNTISDDSGIGLVDDALRLEEVKKGRDADVPVSLGRPVVIRYDCYDFNPKNDLTLWTYRVSFPTKPVKDGRKTRVPGKRLKCEILRAAMREIAVEMKTNEVKSGQRSTNQDPLLAFDSSETLVGIKRLVPGMGKQIQVSSILPQLPIDYEGLQIKLEQIEILNHAKLDTAKAERFAKALNILLQHREFKGGKVEAAFAFGKERLFPLNVKPEKSGDMEVLHRYYMEVRAASGRVVVTINLCAAACHASGELSEVIEGYAKRPAPEIESLVKSLRVITTHCKKDRIQTIAGLAKVPFFGAGADLVTFTGKDGQSKTVLQYFREIYPQIPFPAQNHPPLVNVGDIERPIYLPPHLCTVLRGQLYRGKLGMDQYFHLIKAATTGAQSLQKASSLAGLETIGTIGRPRRGLLKSDTDRQAAIYKVSILPMPDITYGKCAVTPGTGDRSSRDVRQYRGWNLKDAEFANVKAPQSWSVLFLCSGDSPPFKRGTDFARALKDYLPQTYLNTESGMVEAPSKSPYRMQFDSERACFKLRIPPGSSDKRTAKLNDAMAQVVRQIAACGVKFLLVVLPKKNGLLHSITKHHLEYSHNIRSVFLAGSQVDEILKNTFHPEGLYGEQLPKKLGPCQYFANVAMKMNLKHGGVNQIPDKLHMAGLATSTSANTGSTMFVGLDVRARVIDCDDTKQTVVTAVASVDEHFSHWPADFQIQASVSQKDGSEFGYEDARVKSTGDKNKDPNKTIKSDALEPETINDLDSLVVKLLDTYEAENQRLPGVVVVYRNNVSSAHHARVRAIEEAAFKRAFQNRYGQSPPKLVIIMVAKGHNTRLSVPCPEINIPKASITGGDPIPDFSPAPTDGAVLETVGTTDPNGLCGDFYLQAHSGTQLKNNKDNHSPFAITARPTRYTVTSNNSLAKLDDLKVLTHTLSYHVGHVTHAVALCAPAHYASLAASRAIASLKLKQKMGWSLLDDAADPLGSLTKQIGAMTVDSKGKPMASGATNVKNALSASPTADAAAKRSSPGVGPGSSGGRSPTNTKPGITSTKRSSELKIVHEDLKNSMFYI